MNEMDFTGKYKEKMMQNVPRNMPHLKRIINQQVFLEETDPYTYDDGRRNNYAIEAAQMMLAQGYGGHSQYDQGQMLPSLGPQGSGDPQHQSLFSLPK